MTSRLVRLALGLAAFTVVTMPGAMVRAQSTAPCFGSREIASPDGALLARITRLGRAGCGESRVEFYDSTGRFLASADYSSPDGDRGEAVHQAAWSPESQFFVYSLVSAGGVQPVRYLIDFFARQGNKIRSAAPSAPQPAMSGPAFSFAGPDSIELTGKDGVVSRVTLGVP